MAATKEEQNVRYWLTDLGWQAARDAEAAIARGDLEPLATDQEDR